jgi:hypothetical protein
MSHIGMELNKKETHMQLKNVGRQNERW